MKQTTIHLHTQYTIGEIDPRIYGGFLEHLGRAVYEGVYQPGHPSADEDGFRCDTLTAMRELQMTAMRYPGGNFASGYHWQDGVGPKEQRLTVRELAWQSIEPNTFGTDEYIRLCRKMGWTPMLTVNLGTGTPEEARNWVEYCNCPAGTRFSDQRAANGSPEPYGVRLWCLGNEMDGPWQLGHVPADQYAIRAQQAAKMMKDVDRRIELVVCGSCTMDIPSYMEWDRIVLDYLGDFADYISLHRYVGNRNDDTADYLAVTNSIDSQIEEMDAACRFIQAKRKSKKRAYLCFDEWNVWYKAQEMDGEGKFAPHLIEEVYNLEDALVVAGFLNSFIRHADCVKIANIAQIANVIAPLLTNDAGVLRQSSFYVFSLFSRRGRGTAMKPVIEGPRYTSKSYGEVTFIDAGVVQDGDSLTAFLTNRSLEETAEVQLDLADRAFAAFEGGELVTAPHAKAANTFEQPDVVKAATFNQVHLNGSRAALRLPPLSTAAITFRLK